MAYGALQNQASASQQAILSTSGYAQALNQPQSNTLLRNAICVTQSRCADVSGYVNELREIADRLLGGEPQDAAKNGLSPVPPGDLQSLDSELNNMQMEFAKLAYQINRLKAV